jgi:5,6-dimethylbenzimidazole synthase
MSYRKFEASEQQLLEDIMRLRRDVRGNRFTNEPVQETDLERIMRAALLAPSVGFSQPWRFVDIRDQQTKAAVADVFKTENEKASQLFEDAKHSQYQQLKLEGITEAPINLAVFYQHPQKAVLGQTSMPVAGQYSTICAIQNMWLMARALNIGMGWVSILDGKKVEQILGADDHHEFVAYLCIGHVDTFYDKPELETLGWEARKAFDEVIFKESLQNQSNNQSASYEA